MYMRSEFSKKKKRPRSSRYNYTNIIASHLRIIISPVSFIPSSAISSLGNPSIFTVQVHNLNQLYSIIIPKRNNAAERSLKPSSYVLFDVRSLSPSLCRPHPQVPSYGPLVSIHPLRRPSSCGTLLFALVLLGNWPPQPWPCIWIHIP